MQWNGTRYCGFSQVEPWLPVSAGFRSEITVEAQREDPDSVLSFYKKLIAMRKMYPAIATGEISFIETGSDMVLAYQRVSDKQKIAVFCNLDGKEKNVEVPGEWNGCQVLLENYENREREQSQGIYRMEPYEFIVLGNIACAYSEKQRTDT